MTEWLHFHFSLSCIGEGNGNPLQYSCLENPRDGGAWWAAVYGVAQNRTRLKQLSSRQQQYTYKYRLQTAVADGVDTVKSLNSHLLIIMFMSFHRVNISMVRKNQQHWKTSVTCEENSIMIRNFYCTGYRALEPGKENLTCLPSASGRDSTR